MKNGVVSPLLKQCFVTAAVGSNVICHGAAIGFSAILLLQLEQADSVLTLTSDQGSWIASVIGITQLIGNLISPMFMGRCGRKLAHIAATLLGLAGWIITAIASTYAELLIGRILLGLAMGLMTPLRACLIGEYSSPKYRGALLTTVSLAQTFGVFLSHLVGSLVSWQLTATIIMFFPFTSLAMIIYSPESPSWLADKGRYKESREVFRWLRGNDEEEELEEMIEARIAEKTITNATKENKFRTAISTLGKKEFYKPITLMLHTFNLGNFAGASVMASYCTVVVSIVLGPDSNINLWMIILDAERLFFNAVAVFFISKYKRRTMVIVTVCLAIGSQLSVALYVYLKSQGILTYSAMWLPVGLISVQVFAIATGMVPLPNVIGGEVFPLEYRSIGATISLSVLSVNFFIVLKTFPGLVQSFGLHGTNVIYTMALIYCFAVILYLLPETKDMTLQQIENEFRGKKVNDDEEDIKTLQTKADVRRRSSNRRCSSPIILN